MKIRVGTITGLWLLYAAHSWKHSFGSVPDRRVLNVENRGGFAGRLQCST